MRNLNLKKEFSSEQGRYMERDMYIYVNKSEEKNKKLIKIIPQFK